VTEFDLSNYANVAPADFAAMVKSASKDQIESFLGGADRDRILDAIFDRMPGQFRADRAGSTGTVIQWNITGGPTGDNAYQLVIAGGTCTVSKGTAAEPKVTFTLAGYDFLQLISGNANPMMLFMTGKVKVKGDVALAANVANLFDLPKG
jgi:putative sterol carrier protein